LTDTVTAEQEASAVFLKQEPDASWSACIASSVPGPEYVKLCDEGAYPVEFYFNRFDLNGSSVTEKDVCQTREELLASLAWAGQCRDTVLSVWDFNIHKNADPAIDKLFSDGFAKRREIVLQEFKADAEEPAKEPLSAKIQSAADRTSPGSSKGTAREQEK